MENVKLLSITIPTYNRAKTLDKALGYLLPQISQFKEYIELIISDNCSSDNTKEVIRKWQVKFKEIEFTLFFQNENTGFYGNFRKCKELASGEFVWILSDDDFIQDDVLKNIIQSLKENKNILGILYLDSKENEPNLTTCSTLNIFDLFRYHNYKLTLASAVIFYNNNQNDSFIFNEFKNSNLIGFALLVDVVRYRNSASVLSGKLLKYRMDVISGYNIFDAFIFDFTKILIYMRSIGFSKKLISIYKNAIVRHILLKRYFYLKAKGKMDAGLQTYPIKKVNKILRQYFNSTYSYWIFVFPLSLVPAFLIKASYPMVEHIRNFIRK